MKTDELERHLAAVAAGKDGAVLVLADALQAAGDPWGTFIALHHAGRTTEAAALAPQILGDFPGARVVWRDGFLRAATLRGPRLGDQLDSLFAFTNRAARLVESVGLFEELPPAREIPVELPELETLFLDPWDDVLSRLRRTPPSVTRIALGSTAPSVASAFTLLPRFGELALPDTVTTLEMTGVDSDELGQLALPALRELIVRFACARAESLASIARSKLPSLTRLSVWLGGIVGVRPERDPTRISIADLGWSDRSPADSPITADDLSTLLRAVPEGVRDLGFPSSVFDAERLAAVVCAPIVRRLTRLDLSGSVIDAGAAALLAGERERLAHLRLDLRSCATPGVLELGENALTGGPRHVARTPIFCLRLPA